MEVYVRQRDSSYILMDTTSGVRTWFAYKKGSFIVTYATSGDVKDSIMTTLRLRDSLTAYVTPTRFLTLFDTRLATKTTDNLAEGSINLYFTNARARSAISLTTTGTSGLATYNSTTGALNVPAYQSQLFGTGYLRMSGTSQNYDAVIPIGGGGTGSSTQNWVDLTTNQTAAGNKTWSSNTQFNGYINQTVTSTTNSNMYKPNVFLHTLNMRATANDTASAYQFFNIFNLGSTNQTIRGLEIVHDVRVTDGLALLTYLNSGNSTITPGTGYVDGVYNNVVMTGNTGLGALFTITVVSGRVSSVQVTASGSGYTWWGGNLTANNSFLGGSGSGFVWAGPQYQSVFATVGIQNSSSAAVSISLVKPNNSGMSGQQSGGNFISFMVNGQFAGGVGYTNFGNTANLGFFDNNGGGAGAEAFGVSVSAGMYVRRAFNSFNIASFGQSVTTTSSTPILFTIGSAANYTPNASGILEAMRISGTAYPTANSNISYGGLHVNTTYRSGIPTAYTVLNPGSGYTQGVYQVGFSGGHGTFVDNVNVTVSAAGVVTAAGPSGNNKNNGYQVGDTLTLAAFGGGTGATIKVGSIVTGGLSLDYTNENGHVYFNTKSGSTVIGKDTSYKSPTSTLEVGGSVAFSFVTKTANYTLTAADHTVRIDASSGSITATLPTASTCPGRVYVIKKIDASANTVTVSGSIDGVSSKIYSTQFSGTSVQSNGSTWDIIANF